MKKYLFVLLLITILLPSAVILADEEGSVVSDFDVNMKVSDDMINILMENLENLFPITVMRDYFNDPVDPYYTNEGSRSVTEYYNDMGIRNIRMFANADQITEHVSREIVNSVYVTDFMLSVDVTVNDTWPQGEGGCFIGFTNYGVSAFSGDDGAMMISLISDGKNSEIYAKDHYSSSGSHFPINSRGMEKMRLSILHMAGHTYVLIENNYAGQLHDGIEGPFRIMFGTALFKNGDSVSCSFDNLVLRKMGRKW
ncbi:MAG: hypothetical protein IKP86_09665 [Anaerolineaceae bacterium]|nr:hypothetical protein [Anaerolineaceae bacterium]